MSFMSTAPRPHSMPSRISPANGSTLQLRASAGTTSRWPCSDERGLVGVASRHPRDDARAPGLGLEELRREAERAQLRLDVLGGLALAVRPPLAVVRRVEPDQVPGDHRRLVELGGRRAGADDSAMGFTVARDIREGQRTASDDRRGIPAVHGTGACQRRPGIRANVFSRATERSEGPRQRAGGGNGRRASLRC